MWRRKRGGGLVWKGVDVGFGGREVVDVEVVEVEPRVLASLVADADVAADGFRLH